MQDCSNSSALAMGVTAVLHHDIDIVYSSEITMIDHIDGLVQERRNSIANTLELHLSCINPSIYHSSDVTQSQKTIHFSPSASYSFYCEYSGTPLERPG